MPCLTEPEIHPPNRSAAPVPSDFEYSAAPPPWCVTEVSVRDQTLVLGSKSDASVVNEPTPPVCEPPDAKRTAPFGNSVASAVRPEALNGPTFRHVPYGGVVW